MQLGPRLLTGRAARQRVTTLDQHAKRGAQHRGARAGRHAGLAGASQRLHLGRLVGDVGPEAGRGEQESIHSRCIRWAPDTHGRGAFFGARPGLPGQSTRPMPGCAHHLADHVPLGSGLEHLLQLLNLLLQRAALACTHTLQPAQEDAFGEAPSRRGRRQRKRSMYELGACMPGRAALPEGGRGLPGGGQAHPKGAARASS